MPNLYRPGHTDSPVPSSGTVYDDPGDPSSSDDDTRPVRRRARRGGGPNAPRGGNRGRASGANQRNAANQRSALNSRRAGGQAHAGPSGAMGAARPQAATFQAVISARRPRPSGQLDLPNLPLQTTTPQQTTAPQQTTTPQQITVPQNTVPLAPQVQPAGEGRLSLPQHQRPVLRNPRESAQQDQAAAQAQVSNLPQQISASQRSRLAVPLAPIVQHDSPRAIPQLTGQAQLSRPSQQYLSPQITGQTVPLAPITRHEASVTPTQQPGSSSDSGSGSLEPSQRPQAHAFSATGAVEPGPIEAPSLSIQRQDSQLESLPEVAVQVREARVTQSTEHDDRQATRPGAEDKSESESASETMASSSDRKKRGDPQEEASGDDLEGEALMDLPSYGVASASSSGSRRVTRDEPMLADEEARNMQRSSGIDATADLRRVSSSEGPALFSPTAHTLGNVSAAGRSTYSPYTGHVGVHGESDLPRVPARGRAGVAYLRRAAKDDWEIDYRDPGLRTQREMSEEGPQPADLSSQPDLQHQHRQIFVDVRDDYRRRFNAALEWPYIPTIGKSELTEDDIYLKEIEIPEPIEPEWWWRYNEERRRLWTAWKSGGRSGLLLEIWELDKEMQLGGRGPWSNEMSQGEYVRVGMEIILCFPDDLIEAMLADMAGAYFSDENNAKSFPKPPEPSASGSEKYCIIYLFWLCDKDLNRLTFRELYAILDDLELYISQLTDRTKEPEKAKETAGMTETGGRKPRMPVYRPQQNATTASKVHAIDTIIGNWEGTSHQEYFSERRYIVKMSRYRHAQRFVSGLRRRVMTVMEKLQRKLSDQVPFDFTECGFTGRPQQRRWQHENHSSSNFLMNLFEAVCRARYPDRGFHMHYQTLHPIMDKSHARLAEHLCSVLCGTYVVLGGFNGQWAGWSNRQADETAMAESYAEHYQWHLSAGVLTENLIKEAGWAQSLYDNAVNAEKLTSIRAVREECSDFCVQTFRNSMKVKQEAEAMAAENNTKLTSMSDNFRRDLAEQDKACDELDRVVAVMRSFNSLLV